MASQLPGVKSTSITELKSKERELSLRVKPAKEQDLHLQQNLEESQSINKSILAKI